MDLENNIEKIRELLAKERLSEEEMGWILQHQDDVKYDLQQDFIVNKAVTGQPSAAAKERIKVIKSSFAEIEIAAADSTVHNLPTSTRRSIQIHWIKYAAAIILLFGAGSYLVWNNLNSKPPLVAENQISDKAPGTNKATLILADGRELILDSLNLGVLATEGGSQISQSSIGALVYEENGTATTTTRYNTLITPMGGQHQLILPDGSKVWLNAASKIQYPVAFNGKERRVKIEGELFFEVAKNSSKPFIVETAGMQVEVLGTAFNINCYSNENKTQTTLVNGMVKVIPASFETKHQGKINTNTSPHQNALLLKPGEQATMNINATTQEASQLVKTTGLNIDKITAWKEGLFNFDGADLYSVMRQLERWYDIEVKYVGNVDNVTFKGRLHRNTSLASILKALNIMDVNFELKGDILYVK